MNFNKLLLSALLLLVAGCTTTGVGEGQQGPIVQDVVKSPNDEREYRHLLLENGLRVVLISDLKADKSAAALTAFRGSFDDPPDRPGLAHFLEHMLFIGTEKYPEPDGYFSFVQAHGGRSNAYTSSEHTNYFFDIQPEYFREGLDRFAQFFIAPLFQKEYVEREKNAVHSEYQLQIKEDNWRGFAVQKVASNPDHPVSTFNIGTLDTLSGDVHGALLKFFEENYSANQMGLVVLTNETLDEMQPWIVEMFSPIENRNLARVVRTEPMYKPGQLPATLNYQSIKSQHVVSYTFPMPSLKDLYRIKPAHYLANLLGHEGEGSLHKLLVEKGWITSLGAGEGLIDDNNSVMSITIELTPEGARHVPQVTAHLFNYLDMLRADEIEEWLYDEQAMVAELAFRFAEKSQAINAVRAIAPGLAYYSAEDLLIAPFLMEQFDADLIRSFLTYLRRDNVLMSLSSPDYRGESTERWFSVSYDLHVGELEVGEAASPELELPSRNPFMPESLDLVADDEGRIPLPVIEKEEAQIYLDTDVEFRVPRAVTHVSIRVDGGLIDVDDVANADLYARLVQDDLNALAYPALLAGVSYGIATPPKGFRVSIGGYHDKQLVLLDEVLTRLVNLEIDAERFQVVKTEVLRDLDNSRKDKPYLQIYERLRDELIDSSWTAEALMASLEKISVSSLTAWRDDAMKKSSVQALVLGNVTISRADRLLGLLDAHLELGQIDVVEPVVSQVDGINSHGLNIDHDDAAMVLYVQDEDDTFRARAKSAFLTHLIAPGYFSSLRTDQQLGYVVTAVNTVMRERGGISFIVQSPIAGPAELKQRTVAFMNREARRLTDMSEEEFGANKGGLIARLLQRDKNLQQRAGRYWGDLDQGIISFDSNMQIAGQVSKLSKADMLEFLHEVQDKLVENHVMIFSEGKFAQEISGSE